VIVTPEPQYHDDDDDWDDDDWDDDDWETTTGTTTMTTTDRCRRPGLGSSERPR
jgi:hypothetical protein